MVIQFLVVLVSWRLIVRPLLDKLPFIESVSCGDSVAGMVGFTRPHTIKGTCLATISGYLLMSLYTGRHALGSLGTILSSGILANVFIVGVNQLVDVDIDKVNRKNLPLATGQLSWTTGRDIVGFCLVGAVTVAYHESDFWGHIVSGMCLIGFLYSVPPIRLKRFAIPAALCIVLARGVLGTVGGALAYANAMEYELDDFVIGHLKNFTTIMVVFTTVIALMKDVPDVEGDIAENVCSLSVIVGPGRVSDICRGLIYGVYAWTIIGAQSTPACGFMHLYGLAWLWGRTVKRDNSSDQSYSTVKRTEMHNYLNVIWPLFYYEFIAYLAPVGLEIFSIDVPIYVFSLVFGLEIGFVIMNEPALVESRTNSRLGELIEKKSGLNIESLHKNLGLKGINPLMHPSAQDDDLVTEAAVEMTVALSMHSKLTRLTGKSYANAKKLAILCGDWLLSKAVVALADTKSQQAIGEMGRSIATATCVDSDEQIADVIMLHANIAKESS